MFNIELEKALEIIDKSLVDAYDFEYVRIEDALGRITSEDFFAPMDNPPFDKSPLDGFALRAIDTKYASKDNPIEFKVIDSIYAGYTTHKELKAFETIRIMTGAKMPLKSDCVIKLEDVDEKGKNIIIRKSLTPYANYCFRGEDIKTGTLLLKKHTKLNAVDLGVLGSMGQRNIKVFKKPIIGVLVTGDEIIGRDYPLTDGKIYDTNGILITSRLKELGFEAKLIDSKKDYIDSISQSIISNIKNIDFLITTGGVSVGDKDIINEVIEHINAKRLFWKLKFKPGTPAMYSLFEEKPVLSLSGNPFAALATFELLARPILANLSHDESINTKRVKGKVVKEFNKKSVNRRFIRAIYDNGMVDFPGKGHSSGMFLSMKDCNALIDIEAGNTGLTKGEEVEVVLL